MSEWTYRLDQRERTRVGTTASQYSWAVVNNKSDGKEGAVGRGAR